MQPKIEKRKVYPLNSCPFLPPPAPGNHRATFCCCEFDWQHMVDAWTTRGFSGADQQCGGKSKCNLEPASVSEGPPHPQIQLPADVSRGGSCLLKNSCPCGPLQVLPAFPWLSWVAQAKLFASSPAHLSWLFAFLPEYVFFKDKDRILCVLSS